MKKLFALLFTAALASSLAMPVFAQDTSTSTKTHKSKTHKSKTHKSKTDDTSGKMSQ
jgi:hypothetical protein